MRRKILSLVLVLVMIISAVPSFAEGEDINSKITVYVSMSVHGEIANDKDGNAMAYVPITLEGKSEYNIDDAFLAMHKKHYPDGENGYASSESELGLGVNMLWGDTSLYFGYYVNGSMAFSAGDILSDNSYIDAFIYKNQNSDMEAYSKFDVQNAKAFTDKPLEVSLSYVSGYDDIGNSIFSPCDNAKIIINGEETEILTDENGKANITFNEKGKYIISASKKNDESVLLILQLVSLLLLNMQKLLIYQIFLFLQIDIFLRNLP